MHAEFTGLMRAYRDLGYREIQGLPTAVSREACLMTTEPEKIVTLDTTGECLVGSAEQSFLERIVVKKDLAEGRYIGWTACFRREKTFDALHLPVFHKLELHVSGDAGAAWMASQAGQVAFDQLGVRLMTVETEEGWDLVCPLTNVEFGSYGVREADGYIWTYGTAMAWERTRTIKHRQERLKRMSSLR